MFSKAKEAHLGFVGGPSTKGGGHRNYPLEYPMPGDCGGGIYQLSIQNLSRTLNYRTSN